jgi:endonuclease/exonuclease/phosphatase family metal-dependent hydrolase
MRNGFVGAVLVMLGLFMACGVAAAGTDEVPAHDLTLLTWNVQMLPTAFDAFSEKLDRLQAVRAPWIIEHLRETPYDIVCLQEMMDPAIIAQFQEELAEVYPHMVLPQFHPARAYPSGVMFLSRMPIRMLGFIAYENIAGIELMASKGLTLVEAEQDGVVFQVGGTHLQAGHQEQKEKQYGEMYERLLSQHERPGVPLFLMGDFNTAVDTEPMERLLAATRTRVYPVNDPRPVSGGDPENSWHAHKRGREGRLIDHVLLAPRGTETTIVHQSILRLRREHAGRPVDYADHHGVIARVLLRP